MMIRRRFALNLGTLHQRKCSMQFRTKMQSMALCLAPNDPTNDPNDVVVKHNHFFSLILWLVVPFSMAACPRPLCCYSVCQNIEGLRISLWRENCRAVLMSILQAHRTSNAMHDFIAAQFLSSFVWCRSWLRQRHSLRLQLRLRGIHSMSHHHSWPHLCWVNAMTFVSTVCCGSPVHQEATVNEACSDSSKMLVDVSWKTTSCASNDSHSAQWWQQCLQADGSLVKVSNMSWFASAQVITSRSYICPQFYSWFASCWHHALKEKLSSMMKLWYLLFFYWWCCVLLITSK